jgi:hypothetical protein
MFDFVAQWDKFYPVCDFVPGDAVIFSILCSGWYGRAYASVTLRCLTAGGHLNFIENFA